MFCSISTTKIVFHIMNFLTVDTSSESVIVYPTALRGHDHRYRLTVIRVVNHLEGIWRFIIVPTTAHYWIPSYNGSTPSTVSPNFCNTYLILLHTYAQIFIRSPTLGFLTTILGLLLIYTARNLDIQRGHSKHLIRTPWAWKLGLHVVS